MKQLKRILVAMMAVVICLCGAQGLMAADLKPVNDLSKDYRNAIENTSTWAKQGETYVFSDKFFKEGDIGGTYGDWLALSVGRYGLNDRSDLYLQALEEYVTKTYASQGKLHNIKTTEWHRIGLAVSALGGDPTCFGTDKDGSPINLVADGVFSPKTGKSLWAQGLNGAIWGLILLDSRNYEVPADAEYDRDTIIEYILSCELEGGGFALSSKDTAIDVDITAMALQALAPYYSTNADVKAAVDRALECLSKAQTEDGGYIYYGAENSESCAQVLVALCALNIDPLKDARFIKNGNTVLDAIQIFYNSADGGFRHVMEEDGQPTASNAMATDQCRYALIAYQRYVDGMTRLYDFSDVTVKKFKDVPANAWFTSYVYDLVDKGIIDGMTPTTFEPNGLITRGQFTKMMAAAFATEEELAAFKDAQPFSDCSKHWAKTYIAWAKSKGVVDGMTATTFAPENKITREQMATMLGRYAENSGIELSDDIAAKNFPDSNKISGYAKKYVTMMQQAGIIAGRDTGVFDPQGNTKRCEAAKMLSVFLTQK